jgi:hypothetical protein
VTLSPNASKHRRAVVCHSSTTPATDVSIAYSKAITLELHYASKIAPVYNRSCKDNAALAMNTYKHQLTILSKSRYNFMIKPSTKFILKVIWQIPVIQGYIRLNAML